MVRSNIFWFVATTTVTLIFAFGVFELHPILDATKSINVHDTYFVIDNRILLAVVAVFVFCSVYFLLSIKQKFRDVFTNLIYLAFSIIGILTISDIVYVIKSLNYVASHTEASPEIAKANSTLSMVCWFLYIFQSLWIVYLIYIGIQMGKNLKAQKKY